MDSGQKKKSNSTRLFCDIIHVDSVESTWIPKNPRGFRENPRQFLQNTRGFHEIKRGF